MNGARTQVAGFAPRPGAAAAGALLAAAVLAASVSGAVAADDPLVLAHEGFFYVNGRPTSVDGHEYISGQMYVEVRIPARKTKPYPIIMVHGGTMSGTNYTGTPDGREGWAQYFVRQGYAVYVVDQVGRGRSGYLAAAYGPDRNVERSNSASRFVAEEKFNLWPQAHLHTQWPGSGAPDDAATMQLASGQIPAIASFDKQQVLNRDALVALVDRIGPSILLVHSQAGAFGWPVADARPTLVKAILAIEPNGPPFHGIEFVGAPDWFKEGPLALAYGITGVALTFSPPLQAATDLDVVAQAAADAPDIARCWSQREPARQLPNLQKMPVLVVTAEASYHAPYDHCTVKFLRQAGVKPTHVRLADIGIHGNSHVMMLERNNKDIAAVIARWLDRTVNGKAKGS
jgi:pimeloyl-ACP methyl ester carboxylesterase